ncbi:MAG: TRAP transporter large permease subunit [Burkholderiales bacterium]|nr:TRAP transporter large permease subunit [Burkholderiales bacterium]
MGANGIWYVLGLIAILSILGVHVAFGFAIAASIGLYFSLGGWAPMLNLLQQTALSGVKDYNFIVLPLFTVMGMLVAYCGAAADLFNVVNRRLAGVPARLAVATVAGNAVFAAVTGVGVAAAAAFSHVAYPVMRTLGYSRSFATGCIAGSSVLGLLIPPSVFMIVWAILTEQSVGKLFAAGVFPGLLLAFLYAVYCIIHAIIDPSVAPAGSIGGKAAQAPATAPERRAEFTGWFGVVLLVVVTLGGIWLGFVTPTEGSAVGLAGSAILARAKGLSWQRQFDCFVEAGKTVTPILLLLVGAMMYSKLLALEGVPDRVKDLMAGMGLSKEGTLLFMVVVWFILGALIDSISIMLLTVPIFWPVAAALGYDPIVFALVGILVIEAGILTPPFGLGVFVVKAAVPDRLITVREIFVGATPYWILILVVAWLVYAWPPLSTWLPSKI